ncbi:SAM-dependent methyltransferase [Halodesulfurarchaeum formicicum]|uniref:SAM-dependent methyltransferase n=1 Tax=Halodesulfurarchaeum formicicum TaxID=1873524 RepID=A0A1D8S4J7_9EURY|nr:class I SAM-dependent methyltransferase [Halodesulfurarchaeum formicicum]AOW80276.1 SAM-dependent methyltransferase [Halodesulfurarchaeum formicicum]APE95581.1 SAM-dependent methyltransferase [Halodesulfurarchaeum formicicum]
MKTAPFREYTDEYEAWFETFEAAYQSEVAALEALWEPSARSLEVGVGTGQFAAPLAVSYGIEPAPEMLEHAIDRGIACLRGVGEQLPIASDSMRSVLMVTTVCFFEDLPAALAEAKRVLTDGGQLLLGFIDRESKVGKQYQAIKDESPFYRNATFYTTDELLSALQTAGFDHFETRQTIFDLPDQLDGPDPVREGTGEGSFVALSARA